MANFKIQYSKYDQNGVKIPKGKGALKLYKENNPNLIIFDSKAEYERYLALKELEKQGKIKNLQLQVKFQLIPSYHWYNNVTNKQILIRETNYIVDFTYIEDGKNIAEDCKGWKNIKKKDKLIWTVYTDDIYKLKKKLFLHNYKNYIFRES